MKNALPVTVTLLTLVFAAPSNGQSADKTSDEVQKLEREWAAAAPKGDTKLIESLWVDDFCLTNQVGQVLPKSVIIEKIKDASLKIESLGYAEMKIRTYGDTAIVTGRLTIKATWEGTDVGGEYAFTDTFVKQAGKWREVASQLTRVES